MRDELLRIPTRDPDEDQWHVIVETPRGSCNKYDFDPDLGVFLMKSVLPEGMAFPYDFGFLPSTLGDDGDPLDVLLLMDQPTFPGCLVPARLVGVIEGEQTEKDGSRGRNDRLLAVPVQTRRYARIRSIHDLDERLVEQIGNFFVTYNQAFGKKFKVLDTPGPHRAEASAEHGMKRFAKRHQRKKARRK